jgi:hypothetical protein
LHGRRKAHGATVPLLFPQRITRDGLNLVTEIPFHIVDEQNASNLWVDSSDVPQEPQGAACLGLVKWRVLVINAIEGLDVGILSEDGDKAFHLSDVELGVAGDLTDELDGMIRDFTFDDASRYGRSEDPEGQQRQEDDRHEIEKELCSNTAVLQETPPSSIVDDRGIRMQEKSNQ